ncbi:DUF3575 domain-containing protein [uncultured Lutibacter sp.]|uniref:DUF3575 domain-containing protein n=1 Tax=uncultured Lutibacter sp. TaxID=437739 RepID=UPI002630AE4C|nr:DUF3575 domain-containing protein [uncultured Lutibacter sp.]
MKKITLLAILFITSLSLFAQENNYQEDLSKNELKINMSNLIGFKFFDVGYERILNEESTIGVNLLFNLDKDSDAASLDEYRTFSITPYYRQFFSNKYAQGFFIEAFTMLHTAKDYYYYTYDYYDPNTDTYHGDNGSDSDKYTDFAVGISAGGKWVTKRGFVAEIYLGIGRDLLGNSDDEVVGRGGVAIGYRF